MFGLVAPGYAMAEVVVDALLGGAGAFTDADTSTKLKLLGVDVASFEDAHAVTDGALELVFADAVAGVYKSSSSPRTADACSAGSWSATPRRTASSGPWSPAGSSFPTTPRS